MASPLYFFVRAVRAARRKVLGGLATAYYKMVCREFGAGSHVAWGTWMSYPENISIGKNVYVGRDCLFSSETGKSFLTLEDGVQINSSVVIDFSGNVLLKNSSFISEGVVIYSHTHGKDPRADATWVRKEIGKNVWIGALAVVMHSCESIGDNSIVGVATVITKSIEAQTVTVGAAVRTLKNVAR